jgi:hypothetical protein
VAGPACVKDQYRLQWKPHSLSHCQARIGVIFRQCSYWLDYTINISALDRTRFFVAAAAAVDIIIIIIIIIGYYVFLSHRGSPVYSWSTKVNFCIHKSSI